MKTSVLNQKRIVLILVAVLLTYGAHGIRAEVVSIPDPNLRAAIERTLGKASGDTITTRGVTVEFDAPAPAQTVSIEPATIESPAAGEQLTVNINITGGMDVAGYELTVTFDSTALSYVSSANGDYLPAGAFVLPPTVTDTSAKLAATAIGATSDGDGTLATVTFTVVEVKNSTIGLEALIPDSTATPIDITVQGGMVTGPIASTQTVSIEPATIESPAAGE